MTKKEEISKIANDPIIFHKLLGYLASPNRKVRIEVELPEKSKVSFEKKYREKTGEKPPPQRDKDYKGSDASPYYVWPGNPNKFGAQLRLYFSTFNADLNEIAHVIEHQKSGFLKELPIRVNGNELIYKLFESGFLLGDKTDITLHRVLDRLPANEFDTFQKGFRL